MRRQQRDELREKERKDALKCACAACGAKLDEDCKDPEGQPRYPHRVRLGVGRWAAAKL